MEVNKYLVVVSSAGVVGQIYNRKIFEVTKLQFICLAKQENCIDLPYIDCLKTVLDNNSLYFSEQYDLTHSLQGFIANKCSLQQPRKEFMYNQRWVLSLMEIDAKQWITAFISGYVSIKFARFSNQKAGDICIITRRDKRRQGIRYFTRGINQRGQVANSCETQLILSLIENSKQHYCSFVQLRGSIPCYWSQNPNLKIVPKAYIRQNQQQNEQAFKRYYEYLHQQYGKGIFVNLIDQTGFQQELGTYFQKLNMRIQDHWKFVWWDFHEECKGMKFQNVGIFVDCIEKDIREFGYFWISCDGNSQQKIACQEIQSQIGVIRTNCVDSLDRTNVVQSAIAKWMLVKWLIQLQVISNTMTPQKLPSNIDMIFRQQWVANANSLSLLYTGTQAMKTDFTLLGKRTLKGVLKDAKIGVNRYFLGNFYDGRKQDYVHFSLGYLKPHSEQSQKIKHPNLNSLHLLTFIGFSISFISCMAVQEYFFQEKPPIAVHLGVTAVGLGIFVKVAQFFSTAFVRKPLKIQ